MNTIYWRLLAPALLILLVAFIAPVTWLLSRAFTQPTTGFGNFIELWDHPVYLRVIGNTVFSSSFKTRESVGYDVHTHKRDFTLHSAGYSPVVSDGHRLYVAGYYTFYGLEEVPGTK